MPNRRLGAGQRARIPFGKSELGREQIELVGEVRLAGLGREGEGRKVDAEVEAQLAPGGQPVDVFLIEPGETRTYERRFTQRDVGRILGVERTQACAEMYVDRDPAGFGIIGPQQRGGPVGQFDPLDAENAQRPIGDDRARRADLRQLREVDRLGLDPCGPIRFDRGRAFVGSDT